MTLNYGIFDVSDPQNPDRVYSAALLSRILSKHVRDGIVHGDGNEMVVTVTDPPAMTVEVATGTAMVQGRFCESDAVLTLAVPAADTTYARIDRVVVRLNASPGRVIDILVKKGTPAPSPVPPGLTRTPETWELSLAQIFVAAGATMVQAANITDERGNASLCGVAAPQYVPSSQVEVVGAINMQGQALTGLPVPNAATDAARKGYVDTEIAGAIGGFDMADIPVTAGKDWNEQNITNIGALATSSYLLAAAVRPLCYADNTDAQVIGDGWKTVKTAPPVPAGREGTVLVMYNVRGESDAGYARITKNGAVVEGSEISAPKGTISEVNSLIMEVQPDDELAVQVHGTGYQIGGNTVFEIGAVTLLACADPVTW